MSFLKKLKALRATARPRTASIGVGLAFASFGRYIFLFQHFAAARQGVSNPDAGLTVPLNNHGFVVYISASESTELALLAYLSGLTFLAAAIIAGAPQRKMAWELYEPPVPRVARLYCSISFILCEILLYWYTLPIACALVRHGLVL
jgi:hypothetical protein